MIKKQFTINLLNTHRMKTFFTTLASFVLIYVSSWAQSWQTIGSGFYGPNQISSNIQVLSYQDTAFVAYSDMNTVYVKKHSGSAWSTVGTYPTENNFYKFIYGHDNKPLFVSLSRGQGNVSGSTGFYANIHLYENGVMSLQEARMLEVVSDNQLGNLVINNFDFAARPDGSMACIIRFPSSARSIYNVKIGTNDWFSTTVFYEAIGGASGNAIERSKVSFNDEGVIILSRLFGQTLGTAHLFLHDLNSSQPTASYLNYALFSVGSGLDPIKITSKSDATYAVILDQNSNEVLWKFYHDSVDPLAIEQIVNYGSASPRVTPLFTANDDYLMYFEPNFSGEGFIAITDNTYELANSQNLGNTHFSLSENLVSPAVYNVDPASGEIIVAYVHGPPMTQTLVRKFGCGAVTAAFNSSTEILSLSSNHGANATYEWNLCESNDVLSTDASFEPLTNGLYQVTVTDGSCVVTSACIEVELQNVDPVGISSNSLDNVSVFPNPAKNEFVINGISELVEIQILDVTGKIIWAKSNFGEAVLVDSFNWEAGIYFVHIENGVHRVTQKLIIKK